MSEFKSQDAWAVVDGDKLEEVHLLEFSAKRSAQEDYGYRPKREILPVTISPRSAWVKVSERLPELNTDAILFIVEYPGATSRLHVEIRFGQRIGTETNWWFETDNGMPYDGGEVTHWMPATIPEPPKGDA